MKQKTILLFIFLTFSSIILLGQETELENKITATISILGMACQEGCADTIAENLKNTNGVNEVTVSYETKEAVVNFNENIVTIDHLKNVITSTKVKEYVYTINQVTIK